MKNMRVLILSVILICVALFSSVTFASAEEKEVIPTKDGVEMIELNATTYPRTNITVRAGDVLYSPKKPSTFFVGHVAIVGSDGRVYHSFNNLNGKRVNSVATYVNDFGDERITILRPKTASHATAAANFAPTLYNEVKSYSFNQNLGNFAQNYCSKFIWQAFYYGNLAAGRNNIDITNKGLRNGDTAIILPSEVLSSSSFNTAGTIPKR